MMRSPSGARYMLAGVALVACFFTMSTTAFASDQSDTAREQAKQILQDKKYGDEADRPLADDAQRLGEWLGEGKNEGTIPKRSNDQIKKQSQPKEQTSLSPPGIGGLSLVAQILFYILIALIIGGIGFLIYKAIRNRDVSKKNKVEDDEDLDIDWTEESKVLEFVTDAELLERMSDQAEQAGELDLALRYRFRAGLLRLNDMQIIAFHPSVTNAQWQLILNNDSFNTLTKDFNDVTYGEKTCEPTHLNRARQGWSNLVKPQSAKSK